MPSTEEAAITFAARVESRTSDTDQEYYVRVRAGRSRAGAKVIASDIGAHGGAAEIAQELEQVLGQLDGAEEPVAVLELLERGGRTPVLMERATVPVLSSAGHSAPVTLPATADAGAILAATTTELTRSLVAMADGYRQLAGAMVLRLSQAQTEARELAAQVAAYDAVAELGLDHEDRSTMSEGIQALTPVAYAMAQRMGLPIASILGAAEGEEEPAPVASSSGASDADQLIATLLEHLDQHPEDMTQARARVIMRGAMRAQSRARTPQPTPESAGRASVVAPPPVEAPGEDTPS